MSGSDFKVFGREPALFLSAVAVVVQFVSQFVFHLSADAQGAVNILAAAVIGVLTAWSVAREKLAPAVLGFGQAALAALLAFGVDFSAEQQSTIMAVVALVVGWYTRTQVVAPVDAAGHRVAR